MKLKNHETKKRGDKQRINNQKTIQTKPANNTTDRDKKRI